LAKDLPQSRAIERIEEALDVQLQHKAPAQIHQPLPQGLQRLVCRTTGSKAVRAVPKVLLIDGLEHHRHGALQDLVLEGRDPDRPGLGPTCLRDVHPPHGRGPIRSRLGPLEQRPEVRLQVLRVRLGRLAVDAHGAVLAGASVRLFEKVEIDGVSQGRERCLRHRPRLLRDPLEFR